jgi:hypothetical protein
MLTRRLILTTVAALLAITAPADARDLRSGPAADTAAAEAQERYYSSYAPIASDVTAAHAQERYYSSYGTSAPIPTSAAGDLAPDGFNWDDAAIGAGGTLGLILVLAGGGVALPHRRAGTRGARAAAS